MTLTNFLKSIADAIREVEGSTDLIPAPEFPDRIRTFVLAGPVAKVMSLESVQKLTEWKFNLLRTSSTGSFDTSMAAKAYNDAAWENVLVPHDWSIHQNFNSSSKSTYEGGYLDGGDAWYRTKFTVEREDPSQKVYVYFDGVYMESDVYVNGTKVGLNKYGYNPFYFDITNYVTEGSDNCLAVSVMNNQPSSRWYSGSGIFRNVMILTAAQSDIAVSDIDICTPHLSSQYNGNVDTNIKFNLTTTSNQQFDVILEVINNEGSVVGSVTETYTINGTSSEELNVTVNKPKLYGVYDPNMYTLRFTIKKQDGTKLYRDTKFGYRWYEYTTSGFYLNGSKIFLQGVCQHHDLGCLGAISDKSGYERQARILKSFGVNAVRITHNPPSVEFLDAFTEAGILLIEEFFDAFQAKETYDFARYMDTYLETVVHQTVQRDRNYPSIIAWSLGNEIARTSTSWSASQCQQMAARIKQAIRDYDHEQRPVTMGEDAPTSSLATAMSNELDLIGINYNLSSYTSSLNLSKPKYASETTSAFETRGRYKTDSSNYVCTSYDTYSSSWGCLHNVGLSSYKATSNCFGMFVWTGFDYIGEPTPFYNSYPARSSYFGIVDLCGFPKDAYYLYQSEWTDTPMVHILPHWDESSDFSGTTRTINVYSNCPKVELYLNNSKVATLTTKNNLYFSTSLTYTKGTLIANGLDSSGNVVAQDIVYTSQGTATQMRLSSDKIIVDKDNDLVWVTADMLDANGVFVPIANNKITFTVSGGTILGTDNGDPTDVSSALSSNIRDAFCGKALCVIRPNAADGNLTITASANGMTSKSITIIKGNQSVLAVQEAASIIDATKATIYKYGNEVISCTGLTLSQYSLTFTDENPIQLTATPTPADTTDTIVWDSTSKNVATVVNGLVIPLQSGSTIITATCGTKTVSCSVKVEINQTVYNVTFNGSHCSISDPDTTSIVEGGTYTGTISADAGYTLSSVIVTMGGIDVTGSVLINGNALNIRNVNGDIVITAIAAVQESVECESISITSALSDVTIGYGTPLTVTTVPSNANPIVVTASPSSAAEVVQVDGQYRLMVKQAGSITVTATCHDKTSNITVTGTAVRSGTTPVELNSNPSPMENISVNGTSSVTFGLGLNETAVYMYVSVGKLGDDVTLTGDDVTLTGDVSLVGYYPKTYVSTSTKNSLNVGYTGTENGKRYMKVNAAGLEKIFDFNVGTLSCTNISLDKESASITDANDVVTLIPTVVPSDTTESIIWNSSSDCVTVVNGAVIPLKNGEAVITATCGTEAASCVVSVSGVVEDTSLIVKNVASTGSQMMLYEGEWSSSKTLYVELTTDSQHSNTECILSFGQNIGAWAGNHTHLYYPMNSSQTTIGVAAGSASGGITTTNNTITTNNNLLRIAVSSNGLYINGKSMSSTNMTSALNAISNLTTIQIGSQEGATRYYGTYNEVRIFDTAYSTAELQDITTNGYSA